MSATTIVGALVGVFVLGVVFGLLGTALCVAAKQGQTVYMSDTGRCTYGAVTIKPDGVNELDPCQYVEVRKLRNVTVSILQCVRCGHEELMWTRQEDTEEVEDE